MVFMLACFFFWGDLGTEREDGEGPRVGTGKFQENLGAVSTWGHVYCVVVLSSSPFFVFGPHMRGNGANRGMMRKSEKWLGIMISTPRVLREGETIDFSREEREREKKRQKYNLM